MNTLGAPRDRQQSSGTSALSSPAPPPGPPSRNGSARTLLSSHQATASTAPSRPSHSSTSPRLASKNRRNDAPDDVHRCSEAHDTRVQIDAFEALQNCHLVRTLPSTQKQCCTEPVGDKSTAMCKAEAMIRDMRTIGLSGVRLTGDMEHELQFVRSSASAAASPPRKSDLDGSRLLCPSTSCWKSSVMSTLGRSPRAAASRHESRIAVISDTATFADQELQQCAGSSKISGGALSGGGTLSEFGKFPVPTLDDLRQPLPDYADARLGDVGRELFVSTGSTAADAANGRKQRVAPARPTSARVAPGVEQLRVYAAPLYPNIPVAPHLSAVMRWCTTAHGLRSNAFIRHLLRVAERTNLEGERSSEHQVDWDHNSGKVGFVVAGTSPSVAVGSSLLPSQAPPRKTMAQIVRSSKFTLNIIREASHGMFEDHLSWFHSVVAVWFEFCHKDLLVEKTPYRIPGCMGNSASAFIAFFETVFSSVHHGPLDAPHLYELLNDDALEQLTFGRCFFLLYLTLGLERLNPVEMPHSGTVPMVERTRSRDEFEALRKKRLSLVGSDNALLGNTLFGGQATLPADRAALIDERRRLSAPPTAAFAPSCFPSIVELWISWAGVLLLKKCRTINVFHLESVVTTVMDIVTSAVEGSSRRPASHLERVKEVDAQLRQDLRKFQDVVGSRVEVMLEEALSLLKQHTKVLGRWLVSTSAQEAQDELNAIVDCVLQTMAEEEKLEQQHRAMLKSLAAATPPSRKKRNGPMTRSVSLLLPKRKMSTSDFASANKDRRPTTPK